MDQGEPRPGPHTHLPPYSPPIGQPAAGPVPQHAFVPPSTAPHMNIIRAPVFGPSSTSAYCHACKESVQTMTIVKASGKTHLIALTLCVFLCCLCIPCVYCSDSLRATSHYCPNCNAYLGTYSSI